MKRMMKNPAFKQKIARSKKRMKSTAQLLVKAQKQARNKIRSKFFPKYKDCLLYTSPSPRDNR